MKALLFVTCASTALVGQCFDPALCCITWEHWWQQQVFVLSQGNDLYFCLQGQDLRGSAFLVVYISIWVFRCWDGRRTRSSRSEHCRALVYVWERVGGSRVSFAALIAVIHGCLQVKTFALLYFIGFVCQLFPSTCQQTLSHQSCSFQPFPLSSS